MGITSSSATEIRLAEVQALTKVCHVIALLSNRRHIVLLLWALHDTWLRSPCVGLPWPRAVTVAGVTGLSWCAHATVQAELVP